MVSIEILRKSDLCVRLADDDLHALAACFQVRRHRQGEVIFRQGAPGDTMLVIASGQLVASTTTLDGTSAGLNEMGPGEVLGEMAFLDPAPRSATVTAATDAVSYELSHDAMNVLRKRAPKAASAILSAGIRDVTRRLRSLDERIEAELNRLADAEGSASAR
jgi:CRP/FNR family cyclic AMP-dependent transcriptional regulator